MMFYAKQQNALPSVRHCLLVLFRPAPDLLSRAGHNRRFGTDMQIEQFYCQSRCFRIVVINPHTYRLRWQTRLGIRCR